MALEDGRIREVVMLLESLLDVHLTWLMSPACWIHLVFIEPSSIIPLERISLLIERILELPMLSMQSPHHVITARKTHRPLISNLCSLVVQYRFRVL